jgi:hypothetical protein
MFGRVVRIAILLFEVVWFNIIVPGHTRGIVVVQSGATSTETCPLCAAVACPLCAQHAAPNSSKNPTPADRANCAICQFMAHLSLPPVYDFRPASLKLLELLPIPQPQTRESVALIDHAHCRGPPAPTV